MHLGLLFFPWSLALLIGSPAFIAVIAPLEMIFMLVMIKVVEEPGAVRKFGEEYRDYMARTPMFNFHPECIRMLLSMDTIAEEMKETDSKRRKNEQS